MDSLGTHEFYDALKCDLNKTQPNMLGCVSSNTICIALHFLQPFAVKIYIDSGMSTKQQISVQLTVALDRLENSFSQPLNIQPFPYTVFQCPILVLLIWNIGFRSLFNLK